MQAQNLAGWERLIQGYPWFSAEGRYPIPAYSEFMPPPRLGKRPYGEGDASLFSEGDPFGWNVSEVEEKYGLQPGLANLAHQIMEELVELGQGKPAWRIAGHQRRNLIDNPFWPNELAVQAGKLLHERYVVLLPLAFSKTQDDKGRVRWTFFGGSEQGPERAFWKSFYSAPNQERSSQENLAFVTSLLSSVYGETCDGLPGLHRAGFRILPTEANPRFPYWHMESLTSCVLPLLWNQTDPVDDIRYLLTFKPFSRLPAPVRERYLAGRLALLPFPGSLVFWGVPVYTRLQAEFPMAMQLPLQRLAARHGGSEGQRVPQSGWFSESGADFKPPRN